MRKLPETVIAFWVSRNWTADQAARTILAESYYGNGCHGLDEASRSFFGCLPNDLKAEEIALLVGLVRSPSGDNPWRYPERAKKRLGFVLHMLASTERAGDSPQSIELPSRLVAKQRGACAEKSNGIDAKDDDSSTKELLTCSYNGDLLKMMQLLQRGVEVNAKGWFCRTALMEASCGGRPEAVRLLLDKGADVEARDDLAWTALMISARWGRLAVVKMLLERGADVNAKDKWGETALMLAAANGHTKVADALKAHEAKE